MICVSGNEPKKPVNWILRKIKKTFCGLVKLLKVMVAVRQNEINEDFLFDRNRKDEAQR